MYLFQLHGMAGGERSSVYNILHLAKLTKLHQLRYSSLKLLGTMELCLKFLTNLYLEYYSLTAIGHLHDGVI